MASSFLDSHTSVMLAYLKGDTVSDIADNSRASIGTTLDRAGHAKTQPPYNVSRGTAEQDDREERKQGVAESGQFADDLIVALVDIVSQRTGYPPEMLDPSLALEADLGIDSIKRVEILTNFRRLVPEHSQKLLEENIEHLAGAKTLKDIMDWIRSEFDSSRSVCGTDVRK